MRLTRRPPRPSTPSSTPSPTARSRRSLLLVAGLALAVLVAGGVVGWRLLAGEDDTRLQAALRLTPAAERVTWTDWSGVRAALDADLDAGSPGSAVQAMLDAGFERDLTATSALLSSAETMQRELGFSPGTLDWEVFSRAEGFTSLTMRLGPSEDVDRIGDALRRAGYSDDGDGRFSSPDDIPILARVTPVLGTVQIDAERRLVIASDTTEALDRAVAAARADDASPVREDVVRALGAPITAALFAGDQVCRDLAMGQADATSQAEAAPLLAAAGRVNPLQGFGLGLDADGAARVAMALESADQARANADVRATLASGPAPGQGGTFPERFTLDRAVATGAVVVFDLTPQPGAYLLSDLTRGPVLFATC
ncbi:hypothetical protein [Nocardioides sp.]|uniref:hypothetical protein n=1 Tax=Nocardioides sp. TaxID=35761 RepID=UPI003513C90A